MMIRDSDLLFGPPCMLHRYAHYFNTYAYLPNLRQVCNEVQL